MRNAFINELTCLAQDDPRIVILSADIGNRMFDAFSIAAPGRFVNTGIAEANMTGMAAGMAMAGLRPFTYTIASFNPGRCAEQIRLDICQHNLSVVIVGVGAGFGYASLGPTHHALEDIAWMRSIPNMTIVCPGDPVETRLAVRAALSHNGPVYLRLGKKGEPVIHDSEPLFSIGKAISIRSGEDIALLAVGTVLPLTMQAAERLAGKGVEAAVYSFHTIKPLDTELLGDIFTKYTTVAVIEEHVPAGGAWSAVIEWAAENGRGCVQVLRFGAPDSFSHKAGGQDLLRKSVGLCPQHISDEICSHIRTRGIQKLC